jgi:hypothetical protein
MDADPYLLKTNPDPGFSMNPNPEPSSVADPDPGSGALLAPGSGIGFFRIPEPKPIFLRA